MSSAAATPPGFVMWRTLPQGNDPGWRRQWFGNEIDPRAVFNVRGIGIREPMFNADVHRPAGTGDWLIMFFHRPARLDRDDPAPSVRGGTMILWPPTAEQFYSWAAAPDVEPHSWMHVEGSWVAAQVGENALPTSLPIELGEETVFVDMLEAIMEEITRHEAPDAVILRNLFQNWARATARLLQTRDRRPRVPRGLVVVRDHLEEHVASIPVLDELAAMAGMSRSHLCHQFRRYFGTTISRYVIRKRMSIAERLLYDLTMQPRDIAHAVGYPDIYQFSKQFKKSFGISPTSYRARHATGGPASREATAADRAGGQGPTTAVASPRSARPRRV